MSGYAYAILLAVVLAGLSGGATFAFSSFVMRGLSKLDGPDAVRAMQAINEAALRPAFLIVFMGTGLFAVLLSASHMLHAGLERTGLHLGTLVYVVGVVGVTVVKNVPLNDRLARTAPDTAGAFAAYAEPWLLWNHVRVLAAAGAAAAFAASLA